MVCSICNVFGVVVRENSNAEYVTVLAKENNTRMKGNNENSTTAVIRLAPLGIFAIVMTLVGKQAGNMVDMRSNLLSLAFFVIVVWVALIVMG